MFESDFCFYSSLETLESFSTHICLNDEDQLTDCALRFIDQLIECKFEGKDVIPLINYDYHKKTVSKPKCDPFLSRSNFSAYKEHCQRKRIFTFKVSGIHFNRK